MHLVWRWRIQFLSPNREMNVGPGQRFDRAALAGLRDNRGFLLLNSKAWTLTTSSTGPECSSCSLPMCAMLYLST
jgi:hypothetical protein